jgi:hypothetical protein
LTGRPRSAAEARPARHARRPASGALPLGVASAAFFAVTFVLNRSMAVAHGHWAWTASLRYLATVPLALGVLAVRGSLPALAGALRAAPRAWLTWGTVGFAVFYAPLALAAALAPAWVVAGIWPVTIVCGLLLSPLLYSDHRREIPRRALGACAVILGGVALLTLEQARAADPASAVAGLLLVLVSAFAYPLGNREMMLALEERRLLVDPFVRLAAMTLGSLPAWLLVATYAAARAGAPPPSQVAQAAIVALSAGVVATWLFFAATDRVRRDPVALAAVEATQVAELPFALLLEVALLGAAWPGAVGLAGLAVIVAGMIGYARLSAGR